MNYIINNPKFINSIDVGILSISEEKIIDLINIPTIILLVINTVNQYIDNYTIDDLSLVVSFVLQNHCFILNEDEPGIKNTTSIILSSIELAKINKIKIKQKCNIF
jgi:hypothetical protein